MSTPLHLIVLKGDFFFFFLFMYLIQHCPSDSTVSEDAGIEPRTVATLALTARRSNFSARSHPYLIITSFQWWDPNVTIFYLYSIPSLNTLIDNLFHQCFTQQCLSRKFQSILAFGQKSPLPPPPPSCARYSLVFSLLATFPAEKYFRCTNLYTSG
jgi:hypothetical protein